MKQLAVRLDTSQRDRQYRRTGKTRSSKVRTLPWRLRSRSSHALQCAATKTTKRGTWKSCTKTQFLALTTNAHYPSATTSRDIQLGAESPAVTSGASPGETW